MVVEVVEVLVDVLVDEDVEVLEVLEVEVDDVELDEEVELDEDVDVVVDDANERRVPRDHAPEIGVLVPSAAPETESFDSDPSGPVVSTTSTQRQVFARGDAPAIGAGAGGGKVGAGSTGERVAPVVGGGPATLWYLDGASADGFTNANELAAARRTTDAAAPASCNRRRRSRADTVRSTCDSSAGFGS